MPTITTDTDHVTFINTMKCIPENQDRVVDINIEIVEKVARVHPGFVSATVHRSHDGTRVINYLQWRTADALRDMQQSAEFRLVSAGLAGLIEFDPHQVSVSYTRAGGNPDISKTAVTGSRKG